MNRSFRSLSTGIPAFAIVVALLFAATAGVSRAFAAQQVPAVGDKAMPFTLDALDGSSVSLSTLLKKGPVALVVLRGYPGYQCPFCTMQVGRLLGAADQFATKKAQVVLVYPGPADGLKQHAGEFVQGKTIPENFHLLLDPDYNFLNQYGLRWDAPGETSYPSTFVIDNKGKITFAKISHEHGDRSTPEEILKALK